MIDISRIFDSHIEKKHGVYIIDSDESDFENQHQTNDAFTKKWCSYNEEDANEQEVLFEFQKRWYLKLYGFDSELQLADYLKGKEVILDAGSGLGYKSKWFADLSPSSLVLGIDYSDAVYIAAEKYKDVPNLIFAKGDIAKTKLKSETIDYVSCDQVIMHTEDPSRTF
jgi:2-polyprenyl-3-methyl-5-hydroxy-6-metoxy-1,4-benzoquinol methylase